jgi:segregation and condensation protein A
VEINEIKSYHGTSTKPSLNDIDNYVNQCAVALDMFEGPIDLLLHLVKKNELPIDRISLGIVAEQYLECLEEIARIDVEIAGEYLVIASTLLSLKASALLGVTLNIENEMELESGTDPHNILLQRLKEAERYQDGVRHLATRFRLDEHVFASEFKPDKIPDVELPIRWAKHDPFKLAKLFRKILIQQKGENALYLIEVDSTTISERMVSILDFFQNTTLSEKKISFNKLIENIESSLKTNTTVINNTTIPLIVVVGYLLAVLELCRRVALDLVQNAPYGSIDLFLPNLDEI